jgi:hypothetical protein
MRAAAGDVQSRRKPQRFNAEDTEGTEDPDG